MIAQNKTQGSKNSDQNNAHLLFFRKKNVLRKKGLDFLNTKINKSDYIPKTKNRTKNIIYAKNESACR